MTFQELADRLDRYANGSGAGPGSLLEGGFGVVEQDFLPGVDLVRLDPVLVAQVRDGNLVDQIPPENGCLFVRAKASSWFLHGILLV